MNGTWLTFTPTTDGEGAASQIIGRYGMDLDGRSYDTPKHWPMMKLQQIHGRRFLLRNSALEFVFIDRTTVFIDFGSALLRREAYRRARRAELPVEIGSVLLCFSACEGRACSCASLMITH